LSEKQVAVMSEITEIKMGEVEISAQKYNLELIIVPTKLQINLVRSKNLGLYFLSDYKPIIEMQLLALANILRDLKISSVELVNAAEGYILRFHHRRRNK